MGNLAQYQQARREEAAMEYGGEACDSFDQLFRLLDEDGRRIQADWRRHQETKMAAKAARHAAARAASCPLIAGSVA